MKTIEITLYKFEELSPAAQKKAIEKERNLIMQNNHALYWFKEYCEDRALETGFTDIEVQYSLNYCQGDGLSFSAKELNMERFINEAFPNCKKSIKNVFLNYVEYKAAGNTGRYCYASNSDIELTLNAFSREYNNIENLVSELRHHIAGKYLQLCKELEKTGYQWLEDSLKDETIREGLEEGETDFTEDGRIYY